LRSQHFEMRSPWHQGRSARTELVNKVKHFIIDEFQDVNYARQQGLDHRFGHCTAVLMTDEPVLQGLTPIV
jgi:hypothetical protein